MRMLRRKFKSFKSLATFAPNNSRENRSIYDYTVQRSTFKQFQCIFLSLSKFSTQLSFGFFVLYSIMQIILSHPKGTVLLYLLSGYPFLCSLNRWKFYFALSIHGRVFKSFLLFWFVFRIIFFFYLSLLFLAITILHTISDLDTEELFLE